MDTPAAAMRRLAALFVDNSTFDERGYFTGIAKRRATGWRLRDAHWSVLTPPAAVP
jgi:hypothetical protein